MPLVFHGKRTVPWLHASLWCAVYVCVTPALPVCVRACVSGLSSFAEEPHLAAASLLPLLKIAEATVPKELHVSRPVSLTSSLGTSANDFGFNATLMSEHSPHGSSSRVRTGPAFPEPVGAGTHLQEAFAGVPQLCAASAQSAVRNARMAGLPPRLCTRISYCASATTQFVHSVLDLLLSQC